MTRRPIIVPAALAALALALTGCAGGAGGGESGFAGGLAYLPAPDGAVAVTYADLDAAGEHLDVERADDEAAWWAEAGLGADGAGGLGIAPPQSFGWDRTDAAEVAEVLGISLADVGRFAETGEGAGAVLVVDAPDGAAAKLSDALGEPVDGVWEFGGDGAVDLASPLGPAGMYGLRIAEVDGRLVIGSTRATVEGVRDGELDTLDSDDGVRELAEALDGLGAFAASIHEAGPSPLGELQLLGAGVSGDGDATRVHIVGYAADEAAATAAAETARTAFESGTTLSGTPIAELLTLDDVAASGRVVTVTATPAAGRGAGVWYSIMARRDLG